MKPVCFFAYSACSMPARSKIILPQDNRLSNHGTHKTLGIQNTRQPSSPSVCSVYSVVKKHHLEKNRSQNHGTHRTHGNQNTRQPAPLPCVPCIRWLRNTIQKRSDPRTTEHTEHTEIRTQDSPAPLPCVPCIQWLKNTIQKRSDPRTTEHTEHTEIRTQDSRLPFRVFRVFGG
jgi:hypothetical protein